MAEVPRRGGSVQGRPVLRVIVVLLTGAILGFIGVFIGYTGAVIATVMAGGMAAYYTGLRRYADVGWLLVGGGVVVFWLTGRVVAMSLLDPAVTIFLPTYPGAVAGVLLLGIGAMVLAVTYASRRGG